MLTAALIAAALLAGGQVTVIASTPAPAEARPAGAPAGPEGDTRRVCRLERATGSNMQQRVCRDIRRAGFQDQQTREFMRNLQRVRFPDEGVAATPGGPNGS
ncbi:MAG: hypothetical protein PSV23_00820 [Brevundimonas sp.]|uniref:hypothetical protein n=1 Tax=Brevundimonas sp. TaxID=1871086 RepID=UPI0024893680|nr:hypothetical protein [Brevundimonas sp.]MDI1325324.1 hypothetical protein [Brevundimonas sp.]